MPVTVSGSASTVRRSVPKLLPKGELNETGAPAPNDAAVLTGLFLICVLCWIGGTALSVIAWYHQHSFTISMAMFSMTADLFVISRPAFFRRFLEHLSWISSAFAITVVIPRH